MYIVILTDAPEWFVPNTKYVGPFMTNQDARTWIIETDILMSHDPGSIRVRQLLPTSLKHGD